MNRRHFLWIAGLGVVSNGCQSFSGQLVDRNACNNGWETTRVTGFPITVKVPTHLEIRIISQDWYRKGSHIEALTTYRVEYNKIETEKIFTVDMKRPAGGTAKPNFEFDGQYFKKLSNDVNDQTIQQIGELISKINKVGGAQALFTGVKSAEGGPGQTPTPAKAGYISIDRLAAAEVFEFSDPECMLKIEGFLEANINHKA